MNNIIRNFPYLYQKSRFFEEIINEILHPNIIKNI